MQYGRFRPENISSLEVSVSSIGKMLEHEFEQRDIFTALPTAADWGYTFQVRIGKQLINISIVDQDEDGYGIALEPPKDILNIFFVRGAKKAIEIAKSILYNALYTMVTNFTLIWYSKDEWRAVFDTDFREEQN
jgi:hypothetical protein